MNSCRCGTLDGQIALLGTSCTTETQITGARSSWGLYFVWWILSKEPPACRIQNFEVAPILFENLFTLVVSTDSQTAGKQFQFISSFSLFPPPVTWQKIFAGQVIYTCLHPFTVFYFSYYQPTLPSIPFSVTPVSISCTVDTLAVLHVLPCFWNTTLLGATKKLGLPQALHLPEIH